MKKPVTHLLLSVLLLFSFTGVQSQGGIVTVIAGGAVVKDIIKQFEQSAQGLLANAQGTGNFLVGRVGNELTVASQNASFLLGEKLDKTYRELNADERAFLDKIEAFRLSLTDVERRGFELKDELVVDLRKVVDETILAKKTNFYVQAIEGMNALRSEHDYTLRLTGIGFGFGSDHYKSNIISIVSRNKTLRFTEDKVKSGVSAVAINKIDLNSLIGNPDSPQQIPITIKVGVDRERGFWIFKTWHHDDYTFKFAFTVFPTETKFAITFSTPVLGWRLVEQNKQYQYSLANHDQHDRSHDDIRSFYYDPTLAQLPLNQRFVNPTYTNRQGEGCPWTDRSQPTIVEATNGGTTLVAHLKSWGLPCTYYFQSHIEQFDTIGASPSQTIEATVEYGGLLTFSLPKNVTAYQVTGHTLDGKAIQILNNGNYLTFVMFDTRVDGNDGNSTIYSFKLGIPF